jgi:hypothetical protein
MANFTEEIPIQELVLLNPSGSTLPLQIVDLDLIEQDNTLLECRLTFRVTSQLYQQIETIGHKLSL